MFRFLPVLTMVVLLVSFQSRGDASQAFDSTISEAYTGYRAATSYLRTGNPGLASLEAAGALDALKEAIVKYGDMPPSAYAKDSTFKQTLSDIRDRLEKGLAEAEEGNTKAAAGTLAPVRDMLYELRKRNGVRLYADCITELNRAMEPLFRHRHETPDLANADVRAQVTAESRTYEDLLNDCRSMAPESYEDDVEFKRLFDGTLESVQSMYPAIDSGEPGRVINVLRELRSFDRIIYFRFGG